MSLIRTISKISVAAILIVSLFCAVRLALVQQEIKNRVIEETEFSDSGYTPINVYGHGDYKIKSGNYGWYIYDIFIPERGVKKVCAYNIKPEHEWDIDFIYINDEWVKLRSGEATRIDNVLEVVPPTYKWKGLVSSKTAFPVRKPDLPYRLKIVISKLRSGSLSPLEYLQGLKASNPSCSNIPSP